MRKTFKTSIRIPKNSDIINQRNAINQGKKVRKWTFFGKRLQVQNSHISSDLRQTIRLDLQIN